MKIYKSRANTIMVLDDVQELYTAYSISDTNVLVNTDKMTADSRQIFEATFVDMQLEEVPEADYLNIKFNISQFIAGTITYQQLLDNTVGYHLIIVQP